MCYLVVCNSLGYRFQGVDRAMNGTSQGSYRGCRGRAHHVSFQHAEWPKGSGYPYEYLIDRVNGSFHPRLIEVSLFSIVS